MIDGQCISKQRGLQQGACFGSSALAKFFTRLVAVTYDIC
jgi:hypothetical protein